MKKRGFGALLGVGQGSERESQLVVMQWSGARKKGEPVAFVGKGVCFDSGGLSLKPGSGMMGMKGDMGGAAAVSGTMMALAARKAKVNAVGILGLVENMPDGNAQRPGDIVTSMSGQTIEVVNTDAEGRLVLCDALWYCNDRFKPAFMINLATLTGATVVSDDQALSFETVGLEVVGSARKVIVGKDETTIIEGAGKAADVKARIAQIYAQAENATSEYDKEQYEKRGAALSGKVAVIKVGGATETEIDEKKFRVDDAVAAAIASMSR